MIPTLAQQLDAYAIAQRRVITSSPERLALVERKLTFQPETVSVISKRTKLTWTQTEVALADLKSLGRAVSTTQGRHRQMVFSLPESE